MPTITLATSTPDAARWTGRLFAFDSNRKDAATALCVDDAQIRLSLADTARLRDFLSEVIAEAPEDTRPPIGSRVLVTEARGIIPGRGRSSAYGTRIPASAHEGGDAGEQDGRIVVRLDEPWGEAATDLYADAWTVIADEPVEDAPLHPAGTRVTVVQAKWAEEFHGRTGTIVTSSRDLREFAGIPHDYEVRLDGTTGRIFAAVVEPVEVEDVWAPGFAPGDRVKVLVDRPSGANLAKGDVVTIAEVVTYDGTEPGFYRMTPSASGARWSVLEGDLAPVEPAFQVGDRVTVVASPYCGETRQPGAPGIVREVGLTWGGDLAVDVETDADGETWLFREEDLEIRKGVQVGDRVMTHSGPGLVVGLPEDGVVEVLRDGYAYPAGCADYPGAGTFGLSTVTPIR